MKIQKYNSASNPFVSRDEFLAPFDVVFDKLINNVFPSFNDDFGIRFFENQAYPKVDVIDFDDRVEVHAELPGIKKENVKVEVLDGILSVSGGELKEFSDNPTERFIRKELKRSHFKRSFSLNEKLDENSVDASYDNGILKIKINKKEPVVKVAKSIDIK